MDWAILQSFAELTKTWSRPKCHTEDHISEKARKGQTSPEVQNRGISGPTKRTCVLKNIFEKSVTLFDTVLRERGKTPAVGLEMHKTSVT